MDVARRAGRLRTVLRDAGCGGFLVTSLTNVRWLTGFSGSAGRVVVLPDELVLVTDGRYGDQARVELDASGVDATVAEGRNLAAQLDLLVDLVAAVGRLGLEAEHVSWAAQQGYATAFGAELVATSGLVEGLRVLKDAGEVARIEVAADIASAALEHVLPLLAEEPAETEFALALDTEMRRLGAEGPSFETIVAAGPNGGFPHHRPDARRIIEGDLLVVDFGALVDGYHSDMTRTITIGEPSAERAELLALVTEAEARGVAAVRAGVDAKAVDAACRDHITAAGWGERFTHGTGHGVGLLIHEAPWVNATSTDVLGAGTVVTVEPGVYRGGLGGARVEDTVIVTSDGCRPLTKTPKDLSCLR
ncbi:MAG TPA: Xaa-Pro peptidase family protein [Acidimicrobiales bacterium]|jgi:Xaa-Pro aminopeptidase